MLHVTRVYARTAITHANDHLARGRLACNANLAIGRIFERVGNQVGEHLHHPLRVPLAPDGLAVREGHGVPVGQHGVELDGIVYLLPGDYPMLKGFGSVQLRRHAVSVTQMVNAASACGQNLVFFAGCRIHVLKNGFAPPNQPNAADS